MRKHFRVVKVALALGLLSTASVQASCLDSNVSTRLRTYCIEKTLLRNAVTIGDAMLLDTVLKREGYAAGIGLPNRFERSSIQISASPTIDYNTNINGGNPNKPLVLGGRTFWGGDENLRRSGVIGGVRAGVHGREIYGNGAYADYALSVSYAYSPEYKIGIGRGSANLCSRNRVGNHWYLDACGEATRLTRDLGTETSRDVTLSTTKLITDNDGAFHSVSVGVKRHFTKMYEQNQLQLGWSTARNKGAYTALNLSFGDNVPDQLAMRRSVSATVGTTLFNRSLTATVGYTHTGSSKLLGFERKDTTRLVNITYAVNSNLSASVGYVQTDSTIDYFSENRPTFNIQFSPFKF